MRWTTKAEQVRAVVKIRQIVRRPAGSHHSITPVPGDRLEAQSRWQPKKNVVQWAKAQAKGSSTRR